MKNSYGRFIEGDECLNFKMIKVESGGIFKAKNFSRNYLEFS